MAFMTGVGQLPCADTPSPIPRLASPDAHMSPSLLLSLWELQHGCLRWSETRACWRSKNTRRSRDREEDLCQEHKKASSRAPALALHLTQSPHHPPRLTAAPGSLAALWIEDRKALTGSQKGRNPHFSRPPGPYPGQVLGFHQFPLELTCTWGTSLAVQWLRLRLPMQGVRV